MAEEMSVAKLGEEAVTWVQQAEALSVETKEEYEGGSLLLRDVKSARARIKDFFAPMIAAGLEAHRTALASSKRVDDPVSKAEGMVKAKLAAYVDRMEAKRRAEERAAQEVLRKQEEERRLKEAERLAAVGREDAAMEALEEPIVVPEVKLAKETPKVEGTSVRVTWKGSVEDPVAFLRWILESPMARLRCIAFQGSDLNRLAAQVKDQERVPGFTATPTTNISAQRW